MKRIESWYQPSSALPASQDLWGREKRIEAWNQPDSTFRNGIGKESVIEEEVKDEAKKMD